VPERGLRQGDPLAPFLFNLVAKGLTGLMRAAVSKNIFSSYQVGSQKEEINIYCNMQMIPCFLELQLQLMLKS